MFLWLTQALKLDIRSFTMVYFINQSDVSLQESSSLFLCNFVWKFHINLCENSVSSLMAILGQKIKEDRSCTFVYMKDIWIIG